MRSSYAALMQSKYFSPAFNSAIFDGPFRIYFAQFHESTALKIYLMLQQNLTNEMPAMKEYCKQKGSNILIMMYPTQDSFILSFEEEQAVDGMVLETWEEDTVIGLNGPLEDQRMGDLLALIKDQISHWHMNSEKTSAVDISLC